MGRLTDICRRLRDEGGSSRGLNLHKSTRARRLRRSPDHGEVPGIRTAHGYLVLWWTRKPKRGFDRSGCRLMALPDVDERVVCNLMTRFCGMYAVRPKTQSICFLTPAMLMTGHPYKQTTDATFGYFSRERGSPAQVLPSFLRTSRFPLPVIFRIRVEGHGPLHPNRIVACRSSRTFSPRRDLITFRHRVTVASE